MAEQQMRLEHTERLLEAMNEEAEVLKEEIEKFKNQSDKMEMAVKEKGAYVRARVCVCVCVCVWILVCVTNENDKNERHVADELLKEQFDVSKKQLSEVYEMK